VAFRSILFDRPDDRRGVDERPRPEYFPDLNLDQVVRSLTSGRDEYRLEPFFCTPLGSVESVRYRHEVFRDLRTGGVRAAVGEFARRMRAMRQRLGMVDKLRYRYQKQRWLLDAVDAYTAAVTGLADDLAEAAIGSRGFQGLRDYLSGYLRAGPFTTLRADAAAVREQLAEVRYNLHIKGSRVTVSRYDGQADYSAQVQATFERFQQGAVKSYLSKLSTSADMDHVEATVLGFVAKLYPQTFGALQRFCDQHAGYLDAVVADFDREVQFYMAYLEHVDRLTPAGLTFCYPQVCADSKEVYARDTFDLALADKLVTGGIPVVCNDFHLTDPERVIVVSGPNQGGKTTFARTFGQLHHLAAIGCPVPGRQARLYLFDELFTHFDKEEDATNLRGKLEDDLLRIRAILTRATDRSVVLLNEIFTSTALADALLLGERILTRIIDLDVLCVCVTFVDEWSRLGPTTVSMVSTVDPNDSAHRTYKIVRRAADGLAYADTIAEKYGLTYRRLTERIRS